MAKKTTGFPFGFDGLSLKGLAREIAQALKPAWSYAPKRTTSSYYETFHTSPRLDALEMLATDAASAKLELFPGKQYKADPKNTDGIDDHPLLNLLENPMPDHPEIDGWVLRYATHIYIELSGEAFWLLERDRRGVPAEAYIIPGVWVISTPTVNSPWYLIQPMGNTSHRPLQVDPNDVIWFKTIDINNPYGRGRGRVENIGDEIESDELASKYAKNFFYNDATPPTLISIPNITQEEAERFQESWIQRFGSFLKARKPAILRGDNIKVQKLTDTPREMDFVESRRFIRNTCNEHWSMPPELMGILENSNRSTIDSADYLWQKNRVAKSLRRFCAVLNRQLVPQFKEDIVIVAENVIPEDKATQWLQMREAVAGGIATRNEGRNALGLPPDGKNGDVYLMPFSLVERRINNPELPPTPSNPEKDTPGLTEEDVPVKTVSKGWSTQDSYWHLFDVKAASGEEPFKQAVGKYAALKERECREAFKKYAHEGLSYNEAIDKMLDDVYGEAADQVLKDRLAPAWVMSMKNGIAIAEETLGRPISFELLNPSFLNWIDTNGLEKAKTVNATTIDSIRSTISEGIEGGEGIQKLSRRISSVQEDLAGYRAERIARTETASSVNFGAYASYKAEGVDTVEWIATRDGRTRNYDDGDEFDHLVMDGKTANIDEGFDVGGETLMFPGDPAGSAANVINCRCAVAPKVSLE